MPEYEYMFIDRPHTTRLSDKELADKRSLGWELTDAPEGPIGNSGPTYEIPMSRFFFRRPNSKKN